MNLDKMGPPTLEQVLHDSRTHTFFLEFLQKRQAEVLLMFWADCEQFKQLMGKTAEIASQAKKIIDIHFGPQARTAAMIGEAETTRVLEQFKKGKPTLDMFATAQVECVRQLQKNHFPAFLESKSYKEMLQANVDIKNWTLLDTFRDPRRVRALHLLLQVERPDFVETLRFALDLRNRYKPLIAEGLLPVNEPAVASGKAAPSQTKSPQKLHIVKELIDLGRFLEKKYLSGDSKQFAKGVSGPTASRVRISLDECAHKLEAATLAAQQNIGVTAANQANAATRWVRGQGLGLGTTAAPNTVPAGPSVTVLDDTVKFLAEAFKQAEEEAVGWLEKYAMVDARKTDYFLSPIIESPSPSKSSYVEDVPNQDSILVLRLNGTETQWRLQGPHRIEDRDREFSLRTHQALSHLLYLGTKNVVTKNKEEVSLQAVDVTGATVSGTSKGLKFRTKLHHLFSYPQADKAIFHRSTSSTGNNGLSEEDSVIQQTSKVTSLAGVSQQESVAENSARAKSQQSFDSRTLANTELHAHCFPLHLAIEVDTVTFANEPEAMLFFHHFCLPCKSSRHSFEYGCTCLFGTCMTRVSKKTVIVPLGTQSAMMDLSTMSIESNSGSFSISKTRGKSPRNQHYSETALALQKVPNFGLGLNLALNRDGSVVVTRFVSDVQTPSPAAASGKIAVEDELLSVNRVSVHGRRFDDIVGQIKNASSPVYLRFARGSYFESSVAKASSLSSNSDKIVEVKSSSGEGNEEAIKFIVTSPEVVCITSTEPIFEAMRSALESTYSGQHGFNLDEEKQETLEEHAATILESLKKEKRLSWRINLSTSLFNFLDVPHVVDILSALLLERRVVIVSDYPERVTPAVVSFLQIIRPFSWRHDFSALLPESHFDWFTSRIGMTKPFFVGMCTVDVVPPPIDLFVPRRQGRLTLREEVWSTRERDFFMPCERLVKNAGYVRNAVSLLCAQDTIIVDLDSDGITGNQAILDKDRFPGDIRDGLIADINSALGRGGAVRWDLLDAEENTSDQIAEKVNAALLKAYTSMTLNRCGEFALSLREGVVGFYRGAFLGAVKNEAHHDFLEKFTKTDTFKEFVTSSWDIGS